MKSATMRYFDSGVISHEICNHEIFWFWCNNSWNLNPWDTGYWAYIYRYDILDSFIPSTNRIKKVSPINSQIKKPIQINLINQYRLRIRLAHHRTALRYFYLRFTPWLNIIELRMAHQLLECMFHICGYVIKYLWICD